MTNKTVSVQDIEKVETIETEIPALAEAIGVAPEELLSTVTGGQVPQDCKCCGDDTW
jgi:hypothetical protein